MKRPSVWIKLAVAGTSTVLFGLVAWFVFPHLRQEAESVEIVDGTDSLRSVMEARSAKGTAESQADPSAPSERVRPRLKREPLPNEVTKSFFPAASKVPRFWMHDPLAYTVRRPNTTIPRRWAEHPEGGFDMKANSLGMREDEDPAEVKPRLRILFTGDSHMDGVCANSESCANVLERLLAQRMGAANVEALNAGVGAHNLYNYLGTWDRLAFLDPDLFVVVVYGGNDFSGAMLLERYFERRPPFKTLPHYVRTAKVESVAHRSLFPQELSQECYFQNNPEDEARAVEVIESFTWELHEKCAAQGTKLLFVYLPPPTRAQPEVYAPALEACLENSTLDRDRLGVSDRLANAWMGFLEEHEIAYVDLRPAFQATDEPLYWFQDHHLNVNGHVFVGRILSRELLQFTRE